MTRLERLTPCASVRGLVADVTAKVVQVEWFGDQAVKVTFEEASGAVRNRLVYRSDAPLHRELLSHGFEHLGGRTHCRGPASMSDQGPP
jgi:hypothetical protein